ncbi:Ribosomal RNA-processing protein 8 [Chionoecetes opilio]|uniref:Ribosomal RNA-processing protein 8 n=1 Tax=Chionoecetes opilio TaxID=41210 RepID=A0A8J4YD34_CHIOP|nr:Ribosomal RNA-processing protein 8 [Chionoecetes opilio]
MEEEELVFDSNENCNEKFTKDLDVLLSNLDFSNFKTPSSGKETLDDDDDTEVNDTSNHKDSGELGSEGGQKSKSLRKKRKKMENGKTSQMKIDKKHNSSNGGEGSISPVKKGSKFNRDRIAKLLEEAATMEREKPSPPAAPDTLKERMEGRLKAARFRMVNQELYTKNSTEARQLFKRDPAAFAIYHQGYQAQVRQWPVNPLDLITKWLSKK